MGVYKLDNLSAVVVEYIIDKILTGKYKEGDHILEMKIAEELDISRAPVREGIKELQNKGIIDFIPRRGNFVTRFNAEDRKEIFDIRLMLESSVLEILIKEKKLKDHDFHNLTKIMDEMLSILDIDMDDMEKTLKINKKDIELHRYLWEKSGSKRRMRILNNLYLQLQMAMMYDTNMTGDLEMTVKDHYDIIEYLKEGNLEKCKDALKNHIVFYRQGILEDM
ncbi:GntR family transcriptional regulator [Anaeromicrobium sediminis]|uniref:GntR family transcriptional regulator n=1 Tax=Anaeromicrobium sediminis TaxID=1478221 RepID=A0A267MKB5_9FIRM|nr:GntR family transcriptional regulator [Anaeromicrobium sediminis]PAB59230.1 GntR family transcriptional regulator [Anaeromicrobium sediminis]